MGSLYNAMKKRGVEILEDLAKMPELPTAYSVVKRLREATDKHGKFRMDIIKKWRKRI